MKNNKLNKKQDLKNILKDLPDFIKIKSKIKIISSKINNIYVVTARRKRILVYGIMVFNKKYGYDWNLYPECSKKEVEIQIKLLQQEFFKEIIDEFYEKIKH